MVLLAPVLLLSAGAQAPADPPKEAPKADEKEKGGFTDRTKAGKARLLKEFGGSEESEEAVMLGLAWLTQKQNKDGSWSYDQGQTGDKAAATGMAMLAFLGAGQSHTDGRYKQTVQAGLDWLLKNIDLNDNSRTNGQFRTITNMYSQGIATLALVEAYGMTKDKQLRAQLKPAAQAAVNYIQRAQGNNGSWGYNFGGTGDTSIVGWQIQALHAARLTQDLEVDEKVIKKAVKFLDYVGTSPGKGQAKSIYGYTSPGGEPTTSLTAIGLLCRYYISGWRAEDEGFSAGSKALMKRAPSTTALTNRDLDLYFYYYSTQVVRYYGGEEWKTWNEGAKKADGTRKGGVAEWLIGLQSKRPQDRGSWDPEQGGLGGNPWIGNNCGRHGTTCLCLLTLEVYYRYDPKSNENVGQEKK
jgi:hypothetical protein